jgi:uncharacterized LabA/DUF88 family protein
MKSVGVFVNVNNQFYAVAQQHRGAKVDYAAYLKSAVGDGVLHRAFAYGVQMKEEAAPFIGCLRQMGYEPKYRQARMIDGRPSIRSTDWNMGIAMDVMRHVPKLDVVVLGSNDPDLVPLVLYLKERAIKVVILSCRVGNELREAADEVIEINDGILEKKMEVVP